MQFPHGNLGKPCDALLLCMISSVLTVTHKSINWFQIITPMSKSSGDLKAIQKNLVLPSRNMSKEFAAEAIDLAVSL